MKRPSKLHGRAFYESLGSPKLVLAPMVDQSEFAWRILTRSFMSPEQGKNFLAYTPMFHSKLFADVTKYRESHFQANRNPPPTGSDTNEQLKSETVERYLDGNPAFDRPLFVQFCSNNPDDLLNAARRVEPYCDAVDLNLGCPQGIAKRGHYGAFLQEDQDLIYRLINRLHTELTIPVTAKMRILETKEKTLEYAQKILSAGASILTVHGRQREQKGHATGLADWSVIRYLRENLPPETVIFANGNILQHEDIGRCLEETGADGVMSAEGNLYDPSIFAAPPLPEQCGREYWRGRDGKGGYRMDAVMRRYMDIIYKYVLDKDPPQRKPLFLPSDLEEGPPRKKRKERHEQNIQNPKDKKTGKGQKQQQKTTSPNLAAMQGHLFHLLRSLVSKHTDVRDALARSKGGDIEAFENVLSMVEEAVKVGLLEYEREHADGTAKAETDVKSHGSTELVTSTSTEIDDASESSAAAVERCKRPYFICQPYIRPLPKEALEKGSLTLSRKEKAKLEKADAETRDAGLEPGGKIMEEKINREKDPGEDAVEIPREGVVCG
ncbi:Dus-domain-containing protein [Patellaria atrata CBS 101060]|uniref:tRNA-dihydrouridine(16/17) synthase [NAD(P)(+)] n=1 Tax=Patellaria atrata CBS 101060 TaxID=1346257 RepID=A0A9P4SL05_9PEZI|nr:Dus-domain-containing protein [Patellaria atrata CBS 101060]